MRFAQRSGLGLVIALVGFGGIARLSAQQADKTPTPRVVGTTEPTTYGTTGNIVYALGPQDFVPEHAGAVMWVAGRIQATPITGLASVRALLHLPNGAVVHGLDFYYFDGHTVRNGLATLTTLNHFGVPTSEVVLQFANTAAGNNSQFFTLQTPVVIDNTLRTYVVTFQVADEAVTDFLALYKVRVNYRLQVSPAPGTATFADVPVGDPFHRFIEALNTAGITGGCGGGNYCPNAAVTRGQMAVFLSAALGLHWPN
jgi:hypothetical protein